MSQTIDRLNGARHDQAHEAAPEPAPRARLAALLQSKMRLYRDALARSSELDNSLIELCELEMARADRCHDAELTALERAVRLKRENDSLRIECGNLRAAALRDSYERETLKAQVVKLHDAGDLTEAHDQT